jgi:hypothetical protein
MELVQFEQRTPKNLTQSAANEIDPIAKLVIPDLAPGIHFLASL